MWRGRFARGPRVGAAGGGCERALGTTHVSDSARSCGWGSLWVDGGRGILIPCGCLLLLDARGTSAPRMARKTPGGVDAGVALAERTEPGVGGGGRGGGDLRLKAGAQRRSAFPSIPSNRHTGTAVPYSWVLRSVVLGRLSDSMKSVAQGALEN